jgi:signal peptidase II
MKLFVRLVLLTITMLSCIGCDQSTKIVAQSYLQGHASVSFFHNIIYLVYAENTGVMLGIGSGLPESMRFALFVIFIGILLVAAIAYVLLKPINNMTVFATSLIIGGGISNLIDRLIRNGSVIDFMLIKIGPLESGIFNVADLAISFGSCILCLLFFRSKVQAK